MPAISCRADDADKHAKDVTALVYDDCKLYSGGDDGVIKVWSEDLTLLGTVQAHKSSIFSLAVSEDALFSTSNDSTVKKWSLGDEPKEEAVLLKDVDTEYWAAKYVDDVLYIGDNLGHVTILKDDEVYGTVSNAQPIKDIAVNKKLLYTVYDKDVVITDVNIAGDKIQSSVMKTVEGRAPLIFVNDQLVFVDRDGKDLILNEAKPHFNKIAEVKEAHPMIINALTTADWNYTQFIFSAGWDKVLKQWKYVGETGAGKTKIGAKLEENDSVNVSMVVNALAVTDDGYVYVGGSDGHIVRVDFF